MIGIVGNIKVDENKPERIKYLIACIRSYAFLNGHCKFIIGLDNPSDQLLSIVQHELIEFAGLAIPFYRKDNSYGNQYLRLLNNYCQDSDFVINFMEDQFMICDDVDQFKLLLSRMRSYNVDLCKASFFKVEQNSIKKIDGGHIESKAGHIYFNDEYFHYQYQQFYKSRYYIGVNFIATKVFSERFWCRDLGKRPHPYEVARYDRNFEHTVIFPNFELQCAIDDDHGELNTCLLKRNDCEKWNTIWNQIK